MWSFLRCADKTAKPRLCWQTCSAGRNGWTTTAQKQGWITKTAEDFANELKLTRHKYEKAREYLLEMGLVEYKRAGVFGKMAYRLCRENCLN